MKQMDFLVCVRCFTFNHAPYIKEAMDGFCLQQTTFPYVCVIVDDASTDGEQEVIKSYLAQNFNLDNQETFRNEDTDDFSMTFTQHKVNENCFFAVYFLKYNHRSIKKDKFSYFSEYHDNAKYRALCEGDDYWIDPLKLQKQVDFLEFHPDYSMACNRTKLYSQRQGKYIGENYCYNMSQSVYVKDVVLRGGLFISTCSILTRRAIVIAGYPDYCLKCHVGDYPLQIFAAMKGKVYYFNDVMSVYRVENSTSWVGQRKSMSSEVRIASVQSEVNMLKGFAADYPQYKEIFSLRIAAYINRSMPDRLSPRSDQDEYLKTFKHEIAQYSLIGKIDLWMRRLRIRGIGILCPFNLGGRFESKISR